MVKQDRKNLLLETMERRLEVARIKGQVTLIKQLEDEREYYYQKY